MGLTDIINDLRVKFFGYNENDVYQFIAYPKKSELSKLLKDKQSRERFFSTVNQLARKKGIDPNIVSQAVSKYIIQKAKDNDLIKSEILTAPRLQDYEMIIGLDELGRFAFNEKDPGMGFVRILDATNVGKKMRKGEHDKFVANVRNTIVRAYQVNQTIERIDKALDVASDLSLVLGLGGLVTKGALWLGKRVLKDVAKETLGKSLLVKVANEVASLGIKTGDIAFVGSELGKATLNTVAKGLPLSYSLDHLVFGGISLAGFLGTKTKTAKEAIQKIEGTPYTTVDDIKRTIHEEKVPLTGDEIDFSSREVAKLITSSAKSYIETKIGKKLSLENLTNFNVLTTRIVGDLQDKLKINTLFLANVINEPNKYKAKITKIFQSHRDFIERKWDKIIQLFDKTPNEVTKIVNQDDELFEFFSMNTSRALYNRAKAVVKDLEKDGIELNKIKIKVGDEIIALHGGHVYSNDFMKLIDDYVRKAIKNERKDVGIEFLDEAGAVLREVGLPSIYLPTSDYRKVMEVFVEDEEGLKKIYVDIPSTLLGGVAQKFKDDIGKIHDYLKEYTAKVKGLDIDKVKQVRYIYDPATQIFPSTLIRELNLSQYKLIDEALGIFPDEKLKELGLTKERATKLVEFSDNITKAFNQHQLRVTKIELEKRVKNIRNSLKEILGYDPKAKIRTDKLLNEALEQASASTEIEFKVLINQFAQEINNYKSLIKDLKAKSIDKEKAKLIEQLIRSFQKFDTIMEKLSEQPIESLRQKLIKDFVYKEKHPSEFKRYGQGFVEIKMLEELDKDLAKDYFARAFTRQWTHEERWLISIAKNFDELALNDPLLKETDFVKTLELIRDYQGRDTVRSKWIKTIGNFSKIYTMFLPRIAMGAGIQLFSAISQRYPSFRFFQAPIDAIKEVISNPELKNYLFKQIKEELHDENYLSFWIRSIEPFVQTIFYNELLKNPSFRKEVLQDFGHLTIKEFTPTDAKLLAEYLANLIDSPAAISPFMGATFGKLAYIQSWFPYIVAPFQIAIQSFAKSFTSPKYAMNFFKHLIIGSTILPVTITHFSGAVDTIKNTYEGLSTIYHTIASILTGKPEPIKSYLEKQEPTLASIWKSLFSNLTDIPRDELTGRLFHDLGLMLALHGDNVAWQYVKSGLDFLEKHIDLANKNIFSTGSVSTSFEVTMPVIETTTKLLTNLTVYEKEQPQQAGRVLLETLMQTLPIAKNIKSGILSELTQYGRVSDNSVLKYFDDENLAKATGLGYFLGVMINHPITVAKIFDTMFLGGFGEALGRVVTGEEKRALFLPKVTDAKSYKLKILGNEEYVLQSLRQIEDPHTKKNILLRFANVMDNYFNERYIKKTDRSPEEEINMFKSYLNFITYDPSVLEETDLKYMVEVANKAGYYFKEKYGLEEKHLHGFIAKALDELKIRTKLRQQSPRPETVSQGS